MERLFMSAGIVSAIVLCIVGIVKKPFVKFKVNHPKWYKAVFTILSIVLSIGLSILDELYILCGSLLSINFAILLCATFTGVFCGYNGVYEGLGLKELKNKLFNKIKEIIAISQHEKAKKYLNQINDIDEAITILVERKNNENNEV